MNESPESPTPGVLRERDTPATGLSRLLRGALAVAEGGRDAARVLVTQGSDALEHQALSALKRRLDRLPPTQALPGAHTARPSPAARFHERLAHSAELSGGRALSAYFSQVILNMLPDEARLAQHVLRLRSPLPVVHVDAVSRVLGSGVERIAPYLSKAGEDAGLRVPVLAPVFLRRMIDAGLVEPGGEQITAADTYQVIESGAELRAVSTRIEADGLKARLVRRSLRVTPLGTQFSEACLDRTQTD